MTTYDLEILIRMKKTGTGAEEVAEAIDKATESAERSGKSAKESGLKWTELKSKLSLAKQAYQTVASAAEFAYDNIKAGAELGLARERFERLSASIDTTADSLLGKLKDATNGMVSDADLIAGATDIINLGLGKTEEETVRLATAVSTLGLDMQQVILTFANNSKARLDALGLSVEGVTAKAAELERQGFQGDAFDEAVLIGLEEKMALLGDASQTTAGQIQQLEADWENLRNRWQETSAQITGPLISDLVEMSNKNDVLREALDQGLISWGRYQIESAKTGGTIEENIERFRELGIAVDETGKIVGTVTEDGIKLTAQNKNLAITTDEATTAYVQEDAALRAVRASMLEFSGHLGPTTRELEEMAYATGQVNTVQEGMVDSTEDSTAAIVDNSAAIAEARAQRALLAAQTGDLFTAFSEADGALKFFNEDLDSLGEQYVTVGGRSAEQNEDLARLQDAYDKAARTIRDYEIGLKGASLTDEERAEKIAEQQELMNGLTEAMTPLLGISGDLVSVNNQLSVNQDAVTKALIAGADAGGADAAQLALLKVATGEMSEVQAEAVIKSVALEQTLKNLGEQYATGELSLNGYLVKAQQAVTDISNMTVAFDTQAGTINTTNAEAAALIDTLGRIPDSHDFVIKIRTEGAIPALPSGPGGQQQAIPQQLGGPFAPGNLYRVGEGNLPEIGMLQSGGKLFMIPGERGQTFSNSQAQRMLGGYVDQSQINIVNNNLEAAATTNALVQERRRARLDAYMGVG